MTGKENKVLVFNIISYWNHLLYWKGVGGWEVDVSVLVSIPEGMSWEMQVVIKV